MQKQILPRDNSLEIVRNTVNVTKAHLIRELANTPMTDADFLNAVTVICCFSGLKGN